jgi:hypothetical protein
MPRPIIVAATSLLAVLVLGACGEKDASEDDVRDVLDSAGATETQIDCAAPKIADELTQDELNDLAKASDVDDIPDKVDEKVTPILEECLGASESEGEGEGSTESTTSTTAEGETTESTESTTTTTAG